MPELSDDDLLSDLYFQLSSADRRKVLQLLQREELKLNDVAKRLDMTGTEAFRQLQRLTDAGLLEKLPDGKYRSTSYAGLALGSSSLLSFLSKHREHLLGRNTSLLPPEFCTRLGDLSDAILKADMVPNLNTATELFRSAKKRIDLMVEQRLEAHGNAIGEKVAEGLPVRFLLQESMLASIPRGPQPPKSRSEMRSIPKVCAMVIIVDDTAVISLPRSDGTMDYAVFVGTDARSVKWAEDLFDDQWRKGKVLQ